MFSKKHLAPSSVLLATLGWVVEVLHLGTAAAGFAVSMQVAAGKFACCQSYSETFLG